MKNPSPKKLGAQLKALDKKSAQWINRHLKKLDRANAKVTALAIQTVKAQKAVEKLLVEEDAHNKQISDQKLTIIPALMKACEEAKVPITQYLM